MIPTTSQNLEHLKTFLSSPYEVNQELGIATLKAVGIPQENWQEWHKLMSTTIQKLRFCLQYGFVHYLFSKTDIDLSLLKTFFFSPLNKGLAAFERPKVINGPDTLVYFLKFLFHSIGF